jgi:hypothetical protein
LTDLRKYDKIINGKGLLGCKETAEE